MNRLEPNLLLAVTCVITLALLILTATVFGVPGGAVKYSIIAVLCVTVFVIGNGILARRANRVTPPIISIEAPQTAAWAAILPLALILFAAIPVFWSGHDYGLLIIIGAVVTGVAIESALKARRAV